MKKVSFDSFEQIKCLSQLHCSPDGKRAAFVITEANVTGNRYDAHIYLLEDGTVRQLTHGTGESAVAWLDNDTLLFPGDSTGQYASKLEEGLQYTVWNQISVQGGTSKPWAAVPFPASDLIPLGQDQFLCLATYDHYAITADGLTGSQREEMLTQIQDEKDYEIFDELPFWSDAKGMVNKQRVRACLCNAKTGSYEFLTPEFMQVQGMSYDPARNTVLCRGSEYQWMDDQMSCLYLIDLKTMERRKLDLEHNYHVSAAQFVGDDIMIAASDCKTYGFEENPKFFRVNPQTGAVSLLADLDTSFGSSLYIDCQYGVGHTNLADGDRFYYLETVGYDSVIKYLDGSGTAHCVTPALHGGIHCFDLVGDTIYYVAVRDTGLQEIYTCREGEPEVRLTSLNQKFLEEHTLSIPRHLSFTNHDGIQIDGWVMEPVGYSPDKTYPAILTVHGGPKQVYSTAYLHDHQVWANEGYFVFYCNPRGSDGKGNAFADIRGDRWGVWDYADVMQFTDIVLEQYPQIDQNRLGMSGGSYGGFMANWINGHSDRFAAISSQRCISNFVTKCLTSDNGYYYNMGVMQANPWSNIERMWNNSPLKYADKAKTPTLFIQADEDHCCWMADSLQMLTALRLHGVPTRMCLIHGESHDLPIFGLPKHRIRRIKEIVSWFDQYLKA